MKKIFPGNGSIAPYRPWPEERRAKMRATIAAKNFWRPIMDNPRYIAATKKMIATEHLDALSKEAMDAWREWRSLMVEFGVLKEPPSPL